MEDALGAASGTGSERSPLPLRHATRALVRCALQTMRLLARRGIQQPREHLGARISFADGTAGIVYRETVIVRAPPDSPAVLVVGFRLHCVRGESAHRLFRFESQLNTILFAGFPGLISKLWLRHDEHNYYRGFYEWDGADLAVDYVRALWWALALVSDRQSIHYAVLPGVNRNAVLADPISIDTDLSASPGGWWRPVAITSASGMLDVQADNPFRRES